MIETSPLWFTHLLQTPDALSWQAAPASGPWRVRAWSIEDGDLLDAQVEAPTVTLPADAIPADANIRWEVYPALRRAQGGVSLSNAAAPAEGYPVVRGLFRVLPAEEAAEVGARLAELGEPSAVRPLEAELEWADIHMAAKLYGPLVAHLRRLETGCADPPIRFALSRILAAAFASAHRGLVAMRMGDPEGLWAAELARRYTDVSYRFLAAEGWSASRGARDIAKTPLVPSLQNGGNRDVLSGGRIRGQRPEVRPDAPVFPTDL